MAPSNSSSGIDRFRCHLVLHWSGAQCCKLTDSHPTSYSGVTNISTKETGHLRYPRRAIRRFWQRCVPASANGPLHTPDRSRSL